MQCTHLVRLLIETCAPELIENFLLAEYTVQETTCLLHIVVLH